MADVRAQVALPIATDFENYTAFTPSSTAEDSLPAVLQQVISWATALKTRCQ